ncbi:MAG: response regulator [Magnetococcales bacterium]|nr:response regulator [Magnetococcales bacterium]
MNQVSRILIVDDSAAVRTFLVELLTPLGCEILTAEDGQQGLNAAQKEKLDLVLTGFDMPEINGAQLCRALKSDAETRRLPVIIVSAFEKESEVDQSLEAGAAAYVAKKDVRKVLVPTIRKILTKAEFHRERLILVVDDSLSVRRLVQGALERVGFQVMTANNGEEGVEQLKKKKPDLILSDIDMPQMNGFQFCAAVHDNIEWELIPYIVMSSHGERSAIQRMMQLGATTYIVKPFNLDQLVLLVEKLLSDQFLMMLKEKERLENEQKLLMGSIGSLVTALEARDAYTRGHSDRVAEMVTAMGRLAGFSALDLDVLFLAGRLHDIGKIGIRDAVLLKPGKLSDEEFAQIKQHPYMGGIILKSIPRLSKIVDVVLSHHERLDGKGYPNGLKGDEIPLWARMTAVTDTFDALTSDRPYRKGMELDRALSIITEVRGTQLCPDSVDLFFKWLDTNPTLPK